jgi:signal peptidase I
LITIIAAVAIFFLLRLTVQGYAVQYSSMFPTIEEGEWIMVNKAAYFFSDPQRGDIIVFHPPVPAPYPFIKRVIGLPGDVVEIKNGTVFVNGIPLEEEYISAPPNYQMAPTEIPANEYFVLGDNRNNSNDSHTGWTVPRDKVIGKAWFTYWPPTRWKIIKHYRYPQSIEIGTQESMPAQ